jgi:oxygen-independent coproporphyrinogen-3 oxidase
MATGIYISVPFCPAKCSYCNFASGVFAHGTVERYLERLTEDIAQAAQIAAAAGGMLQREADSVYLGGGTPSTLQPEQLERIFRVLRSTFEIAPGAEITVECAPGTLPPEIINCLARCGVNRVSLGVQSFVKAEAAAVGRMHDRAVVLDDLTRLRSAGIPNFNLDLIAGLPHQTMESWRESLRAAIDSGAPHVSVYMLEVDEESRLGRELIAGGTRYHAHFVPDDDLTADLYLEACARLEEVGIAHYEISNFARPGMESRHNLKYWTREPYMGFGLDAHSMLHADPYLLVERAGEVKDSSAPCLLAGIDADAVRFAAADVMESYLAGKGGTFTVISEAAALEETFFLSLRLVRDVDLKLVTARFGAAVAPFERTIEELAQDGLLERNGDLVRLTARGRLLSNEVFARFIRDQSSLAGLRSS